MVLGFRESRFRDIWMNVNLIRLGRNAQLSVDELEC